ncbi:dipeptide ABC transporter ATP-binding protein [Zhihengliuella flava]|uniref:Peptide/nickel transport system ATP-binding protein n=1 Tax=Zhihengliuella flava TaxID=1285193 RepID=A0A931DC48_9MICC|nr:ABC transporter ATP-binding protein [Zhihengliuella flava]MBG6084045.1 peptide/nickel transport system ATP-binding protein [Zhihengliuella flava]
MSAQQPTPTDPSRHLVDVQGLSITFGAGRNSLTTAVDGLDLRIEPGESVALIGESGSGKSVTARALLGLVDGGAGGGAEVTARRFDLGGRSMLTGAGRLTSARRRWRGIRGRDTGFVLQDALTALDPLRPIGREISDALRLHTRLSPADRADRVGQVLADVGLGPGVASMRSGELSGGMRQRALIATALVAQPRLLIADEPSTALDATVAAGIMDLLTRLRREHHMAQLLISHDLAVVGSAADRVLVMHQGRVVESGPTRDVLTNPRHHYTQMLLDAVPAGKPRGTRLCPGPAPDAAPARSVSADGADPVLRAHGLSKSFDRPAPGAGRERFTAVDGVSLEVAEGTTLGIVGESGSGKTTTARLLLGLTEPDAGRVELFGRAWAGTSGSGHHVREAERRDRRHQLGAVYQDPLSSFDPRWTVGALLADALSRGRTARAGRYMGRIQELLGLVGLSPELSGRHPRTLSGGQRQRVAIARALAPEPRVIVCDEPVSALDVSVQAQVLDLLDDLQRELGLTYLFISHDLAVVQHVSDSLVVMREGRIVESGPAADVFAAPQHEYTRALLAAAPTLPA